MIIIKAGGIAMVKEIVAEEFESEVLGADVPVLVDFLGRVVQSLQNDGSCF